MNVIRWIWKWFRGNRREFDTTHQGFEMIDTRFLEMEEGEDYLTIDGRTMYRSELRASRGSNGTMVVPDGVANLIANGRAFFVRYDGVVFVER